MASDITATTSRSLYVYDTTTSKWTKGSAFTNADSRIIRMAVTPSGTGYAMDINGHLWSFTSSGTTTYLGIPTATSSTAPGFYANGDMYSTADGKLYLLSAQTGGYVSLWYLNPTTLKAEYLGDLFATSVDSRQYNGLAVTSNGTFASSSDGYMIKLNPLTMQYSSVSGTTDGSGSTDLASCYFPSQKPEVSAVKSVAKVAGSTGTDIRAGDTLEYTIVVKNTGTLPAGGSLFKDALPAGTTYVPGSATINGFTSTTLNGTTINLGGTAYPFASSVGICSKSTTACTDQVLKIDTTPDVIDNEAVIKFRVTVNSGVSSIRNVGTINYNDGGNPPTDIPTNTVDTPVGSPPQLTLAKTSNGPWTVGQSGANYTLTVKNTSTTATSGTITLRDQLPAGITLPAGYTAPTGWNVTTSGQQVTFTTTQTLAAGASLNLTFPVNVTSTAASSVTNKASVGGGGDPDALPDPSTCTPGTTNPANQCAQTVTTINKATQTDLAVYKDVDLSNSRDPKISKFYVGDTVTYTLQVVNNGPADADGALLTDVAEPGLEGLTWTCTVVKGGAQCPAASGTGLPNFTIPKLPAGSELKITYTAKVTAVDPQLTNNVEIQPPSGITDTNPANNKDLAYICTFNPDLPTDTTLTIAKTSNGPWSVGQSGANYTLTVTNVSNSPTQGTITVKDLLPAGITPTATTFSPATNWTCTVSGQLITCTTTAVIEATKTAVLTIPVNVTSTVGSSVINKAAVGGGGDPDNIPDPATCTPGTTNPANQCAQDTTTINTGGRPVKLDAIKTVQNITAGGPVGTVGSGKPGDVLEYCITTTNVGYGVATNLRFADTVPLTTTFQVGGYGLAGQDIRYTDPARTVQLFTATADGDPGLLSGGRVYVNGIPARLDPGQQYQVCFRATIK